MLVKLRSGRSPACLARHGREAEATVILRELEELRETEYVDAYFMAFVYDALGHTEDAFAELARAVAENSTSLFMMDVDPRLSGIRADTRFTRLRNRLFSHTARKVSELKRESVVIPQYAAKDSAPRHRAAS